MEQLKEDALAIERSTRWLDVEALTHEVISPLALQTIRTVIADGDPAISSLSGAAILLDRSSNRY
jgi:hypothetical protein